MSAVDWAVAVAGRPKLNAVMITESVIAKGVLITKKSPSFELLHFWQSLFQKRILTDRIRKDREKAVASVKGLRRRKAPGGY
jgi:hypothetical protein